MCFSGSDLSLELRTYAAKARAARLSRIGSLPSAPALTISLVNLEPATFTKEPNEREQDLPVRTVVPMRILTLMERRVIGFAGEVTVE